ncbi:RQC-minor-1 family DNA-binding protein [Virgibacillus sp. DJP39]|uniref:RQC-minor-1 family DNA-binding protein n=1 Tax=Virgibacillus sp. DJP39 TaxID=3409790 RepID=UPI003BB7C6E0
MKAADTIPEEEIRVILRTADEIIAQGGRTLLAKILKGSREKKIIELHLNQCAGYGYFNSLSIKEITAKIDWLIDYDFLDIEYSGKLPMIVFTDRGWMIERDQMTKELLVEWNQWLEQEKQTPDMSYLKDRNRGMIMLFLEKIRETRNPLYISYLEAWEKGDYKKVRVEIRKTIEALRLSDELDIHSVRVRNEAINEALVGSAPQDLLLKCWVCGERFPFTTGEQQFYKQKGFVHPKRCKECREAEFC